MFTSVQEEQTGRQITVTGQHQVVSPRTKNAASAEACGSLLYHAENTFFNGLLHMGDVSWSTGYQGGFMQPSPQLWSKGNVPVMTFDSFRSEESLVFSK